METRKKSWGSDSSDEDVVENQSESFCAPVDTSPKWTHVPRNTAHKKSPKTSQTIVKPLNVFKRAPHNKPAETTVVKPRNVYKRAPHNKQAETKEACFDRRSKLVLDYLESISIFLSVLEVHAWLAEKEKAHAFLPSVPYIHAVLFSLKDAKSVKTVYGLDLGKVLWGAVRH